MNTEVNCSSCKYKWTTKSQLKYVTCPSCGKKTERKPKLNSYSP